MPAPETNSDDNSGDRTAPGSDDRSTVPASPPQSGAPFHSLLLLVLCIGVAYAYFYGGGLWNQNSRYNAIFAFVEPGHPEHLTFRIDRFITDPAAGYNTGDWARYRGHYYSNKAPGTLLLGATVYAVLYAAETAAGIDTGSQPVQIANLYIINLLVSGAVAVVGLYCFGLLVSNLGVGTARVLSITAALGFGTLMFPYSTQFWGHTTAAAFVMMGLWALSRRSPAFLAGAGFCLGMATLCDYLAAIAVVICGLFTVITERRRAIAFLVGGLPPLAAFMTYHALCFGSPFAVANQFENPIFREGGYFLGFGGWRFLRAFFSLLTTRYRGIPVQMPVLVLGAAGAVFWIRRRPRDPFLWLCLANIVAFLAANALFNGWHGGATVGPRYQIIALVFWTLCLKAIPWRGLWKTLFWALLGVSALNMLAISAVSPVSPPAEPGSPAVFFNPLYGWTYGRFLAGDLAPYKAPLLFHDVTFWNAFNLGHLLGLRGLTSIVPLLVLQAVGLFFVWRAARRSLPAQGQRSSASDRREAERPTFNVQRPTSKNEESCGSAGSALRSDTQHPASSPAGPQDLHCATTSSIQRRTSRSRVQCSVFDVSET